MNKENCALKLVDEIILYYDARSIKHQTRLTSQYEKKLIHIHLFMSIVLRVSICMSQNIQANFHTNDSLLQGIALHSTLLSCFALSLCV